MLRTNNCREQFNDIVKKSETLLGTNSNLYRATFRAYGNIDHDEDPYSLVCKPLEVMSPDINDIVRTMQAYIRRYNLGAGNMSTVNVTKGNKTVAKIYYNGRVNFLE